MNEKSHSLRIFVSSPGDVAEERALTKRVIERLAGEFADRVSLEPIFWEHEPLLATSAFQGQIIRPSETDIVVAILWSRLGTRLPTQFTRPDGSRYASGTEFEFEDAVEARRRLGKPDLLVYRKTADPVVSLKDKRILLEKLSQKEALDTFFEKWFLDKAEGTLIAAFHPFERAADFEELLEVHLRKLIERRLPEIAHGKQKRTASVQWKKGSPYRGLHAFHVEHAPIFFGRTNAVSDVLSALRIQAAQGRAFVLVLGMSGGGKSSLVQAGVLPVLTQPGVIEGVGMWRQAVMRPSDSSGDMLDALAASILKTGALPELASDAVDVGELAHLLRETPKAVPPLLKAGLAQRASELAKAQKLAERPAARLALVVDQLEEMFTLERVTATERERFAEALDVLARSGWVWVIASVRSDFYPRCAEIEKLLTLKEGAGQYDLRPPTPAEMGQIIRQPALAAGLDFEEDRGTKERLDEVLRDAAARNPKGLALLEFTLEELYKNRTKDGFLTFEAYQKLGGVEGALAQRAEEVYAALEPGVRSSFGQVFNGLIGLGQGEGDTITRKYALLEAITVTPEGKRFVDAFVEARLFVTDLDDAGRAVVSVVHEALLQHWPRLQTWVEKNRENLRARARVAAAAYRWLKEGRSRDFLLTAGKPLAEAEELAKNADVELLERERTFIRASVARKNRMRWLKRGVISAMAILTIAAAGAAYLADKQRERAEIEAATSSQVSSFLTELFEISDPSLARGNSITAREVLDKGVDSIEEKLKDQPEIQAYLMTVIAAVYQNLGLYAQADHLFEKALSIRRQCFGNEHLSVCESMYSYARLLSSKGDYDRAGPLLRDAIELHRKLRGDRQLYIEIVNELAGLYWRQGDYDSAEPLFRDALAGSRELYGNEHKETASGLNNLALLLYYKGDYDSAEPLFREALTINKKLLGDTHPHVADTLSNLANLQEDKGNLDEAEALNREALDMNRRLYNDEHPRIAQSLNNLGSLLFKKGDHKSAESLFREALAMRRKMLGDKHPDVAESLNNIAAVLNARGDYESAEPLYRESLAVLRETVGDEHPSIAVRLHNLAMLLGNKGEYAEAEVLFRESLAMHRKILGESHPRVAYCLNSLAALYAKMDNYDDAAALFGESLQIRQKVLPEGHPQTISSMTQLGHCLAKTRRFEEAEKYLLGSLRMLDLNSGLDSKVVIEILGYIVQLYTAWGKPEKAAEFRTKLEAVPE